MPTNQFVESSFWNFDSLFQPQSHPARDAHDTFFIKEPAQTVSVPEDYLEIVKKTHEVGGFGSLGYHYKWKREEAFKNLLRTHTTVGPTNVTAADSALLTNCARTPETKMPTALSGDFGQNVVPTWTTIQGDGNVFSEEILFH